jgi:energy-coupling factor transport system ATP-binding protein
VFTPHGIKIGNICFEGVPLDDLNHKEQSSRIGFVLQSPENQIVTDKVWHELAFGLESLSLDTASIRLRVAEMASFFGIQNWFYKNVTELSGGQKQILNLASIMAMQPSVLILDEPTSQLDPIAASDFLATIAKINRELGTTIVLTEHRLEESMPLADRAVVMENGSIIFDGKPRAAGESLNKKNNKMFLAMPVPMRVYAGVETNLSCPITVREGRQWLDEFAKESCLNEKIKEKYNETKILSEENSTIKDTKKLSKTKNYLNTENEVISIEEAWFRYEIDLPDVVKGVNLKVSKGEFLAILGGNGTGKTTTLSLLSGLNRPYRGKVMLCGRALHSIPDTEKFNGLLGVLPQNPQSLFVKKTVELDLLEMLKGRHLTEDERKKRIMDVSVLCRLENLMNQHPYDLSGGEQQRAALAKVLLLEPQILLLDEPTKGMDAEFKQVFAGILKRLLRNGVTVVMVSHDIEFCASYADRCALFFDGGIVTDAKPKQFFSGNSFYTTAANRMARHLISEAITAEDIIIACGGSIIDDDFSSENITITDDNNSMNEDVNKIKADAEKVDFSIKGFNNFFKKSLVTIKKLIALISFITFWISIKNLFPIIANFAWTMFKGEHLAVEQFTTNQLWSYASALIVLTISATAFCMSIFSKSKAPQSIIQVQRDKRKLSKRTIIATVLILLLIPFTIYIGVFYLGDRKYYFISLLIILETMLPFVMIFEGRKPLARELVIIAVLCGIGVAGRAAFFMLPQFKPVAAIVIISSVAFGAESGFLVGSMTMFLSNMLYGQGPWTPWQMFAMGIIGFLSGVLFRKGLLRRDGISLAVFGGISVFLVYGGIMNPASVIMFQSNVSLPMIVTSWVTGAPFDLIHATATVFFLLTMGEPMLEKLDRIKVKYGLVES